MVNVVPYVVVRSAVVGSRNTFQAIDSFQFPCRLENRPKSVDHLPPQYNNITTI